MSVLAITTVVALLTSILSTILVDRFLTERISLIGSIVGLERTLNDGIAFGIDLPGWILAVLIPVALVLLARLAWKLREDQWMALGFGLILGGALGNIADRFNDGHVTDFIQIGWWPLFNIADSCITVGVMLLLYLELCHRTSGTASKESRRFGAR